MKNNDKTNVMRTLDGKKIPYVSHTYKPDPAMSGSQIARLLNEDENKVFKTLVTQGKSGQYYVFVVPVGEELDLKKAAKAANEKAEGTAAFNRLCAWGMLPGWHEEKVPCFYS